AELDARRVRIEDRLDLLEDRVPLLELELAAECLHELIFFGIAPPPGPLAEQMRGDARIGREHDRRAERVPELGLVSPPDHRRPVRHLKIDLEADLLELTLRDERRLVVVLVLGRHEPPDRRSLITGFFQEAAR